MSIALSCFVAYAGEELQNLVTISLFIVPLASILFFILFYLQALFVNYLIRTAGKGPIFEFKETNEDISD